MPGTEEHVSELAVKSSATRLVPAGTVLVVVKSKILMRRLPVAVATVPRCFNQDVKGISPTESAQSPYLAAHLRLAQGSLLELARGANTEGLTLDHLRGHAVMQPPAQLVLKYVRYETLVREGLVRQRRALDTAEGLFASLVHRAFRGELRAT